MLRQNTRPAVQKASRNLFTSSECFPAAKPSLATPCPSTAVCSTRRLPGCPSTPTVPTCAHTINPLGDRLACLGREQGESFKGEERLGGREIQFPSPGSRFRSPGLSLFLAALKLKSQTLEKALESGCLG